MADHDPLSGLDAGARAALAQQPDRPGRQPEQLDLLGLPPINNGQDLVVPRGSRAGIRNRRTQEWGDYLLSRYESPLEIMVAMSNLPVAELARSAHCTLERALAIKLKAAELATPYLHPRLASIDVALSKPGHPGGVAAQLRLRPQDVVEELVAVADDE